jgi:hypothetical protein
MRVGSFVALGCCAMALAGCGAAGSVHKSAASSDRVALVSYLAQIEPLRLAVNSLLNTADPILSGLHDHRLSRAKAAQRMDALERKFADYTVDVAAIEPATTELSGLHSVYAHTYVLEDAYLSALVSGLQQDDLGGLPDTQDAQRAAIIQWRTGLTVLARQTGVVLPADLQQAGRGEIAPSPGGS